jgi:hypothetical protein
MKGGQMESSYVPASASRQDEVYIGFSRYVQRHCGEWGNAYVGTQKSRTFEVLRRKLKTDASRYAQIANLIFVSLMS